MFFDDPTEALREFRASGGAMLFHAGGPRGLDCWEVLDADAVAKREVESVREATADALRQCCLTDIEIDVELADWIEPDYGDLMDYATGEYLRKATKAERDESAAPENNSGGQVGVITVDIDGTPTESYVLD